MLSFKSTLFLNPCDPYPHPPMHTGENLIYNVLANSEEKKYISV